MKDLPNLTTTLIVVPDYNRGRQFIRDHIHVSEQRDSHNFIGSYHDTPTELIHFRIIYDPSKFYGLQFHDYILHGQINDHMLTMLDRYSNIMKNRYRLDAAQ